MKKITTAIVAGAFVAAASLAHAGGHAGNPAVKARQAHMQLYQHNLGILGGMARGTVDYDAGAAQAAANNLATLSTLDQRGYWVPGTSRAELGEETRALPVIWEAGSTARDLGAQFVEAAAALAAVAGNGQEAIGPALGPVGAICGTCHENNRFSNN